MALTKDKKNEVVREVAEALGSSKMTVVAKYQGTTVKAMQQPEVRDRFTKIGIGFVNRDESINVVLSFTPVNGRLHIRKRSAKFDQDGKAIQKVEYATRDGELAAAVRLFLDTPLHSRDSITLRNALAKFDGGVL